MLPHMSYATAHAVHASTRSNCHPTGAPVLLPCPANMVAGSTDTSLWTHYKNGAREYCGNSFPDGMRKNERLAHNVITPTTKAEDHDAPISPKEIVEQGHMSQADWDAVGGGTPPLPRLPRRRLLRCAMHAARPSTPADSPACVPGFTQLEGACWSDCRPTPVPRLYPLAPPRSARRPCPCSALASRRRPSVACCWWTPSMSSARATMARSTSSTRCTHRTAAATGWQTPTMRATRRARSRRTLTRSSCACGSASGERCAALPRAAI